MRQGQPVIAGLGAADRRAGTARRPFLPAAVTTILLAWMTVVAVGAAWLVGQSLGLTLGPFAGEPGRNHATFPMWVALVTAIAISLGTALLVRRLAPAAALPATIAASAAVPVAAAIATNAIPSLFVALVLFAVAWLTGDVLLARSPAAANVPVVRASLAIALGCGLVGLLLLALAAFGQLSASTTAGSALVISIAALAWDRSRLSHAPGRLRDWSPAPPTWFETIVIGLAAGLLAYATLAAFAPEVHSDAIRHHLPIAREIWQTGTAGEFPPMWTSRSPIQAHLLYAVAYGFGGMTAAKLVHTFTGLVALLGIAGLGWLGSGRLAAVVGAAIFASMPLVLWELGIAYVDLFPVLYTVAAALAVVLWQRGGHLTWLVLAGALAGFGFAAKMTMGLTIVALGLAVVIVGRGPWRWRERIVAGLAFGLGALVVLPWLLRSYLITGVVPGVSILTDHLTGSATTSDLPSFGLGRSPWDLLRIPWALTFQGELFHQEGRGDTGVGLLLLLPLVILAPRTRLVAFLGVTAVVSYLGWAFTAQLTRYALPTLALVAALCGIAVAAVMAKPALGWRRPLARIAPAGMVLSLLAAPLLLLPGAKSGIPIEVVTGRESPAAFIDQTMPAASILDAASTILPPDTVVGYTGKWEGAQAYTEARLTYFSDDPRRMGPGGVFVDLHPLGATAEEVLSSLDRLGIDFIIWSRKDTRPEDWRATVLSTDFLRQHTRVLAAEDNAYLLEVVPNADDPWGVDPDRNWLRDPGLNTVGASQSWQIDGRARVRRGIVSMRAGGALVQQTPVTAGSPYLLTVSVRCLDPNGGATLALRWLDDRGGALNSTLETVIPGATMSDQFLWQVAPERAASVSVELSASSGTSCDYDRATLNGPS